MVSVNNGYRSVPIVARFKSAFQRISDADLRSFSNVLLVHITAKVGRYKIIITGAVDAKELNTNSAFFPVGIMLIF